MGKRVLLCLSHSIEEYDQLKLLHSQGYEVASIGGYINPAHPHDDKRPALPEVPWQPEVQVAVDALGTPDNLGAAQSQIPEGIFEWLGDDGVIIFHHYLSERLFPQWNDGAFRAWREGGGRVVWRTVGQSVEHNERTAEPYRAEGLGIVRYSEFERNIPGYVGEDCLIRFYKDSREWQGWHGEEPFVTNVTQDLYQRQQWTNGDFWLEATSGLAAVPAGPGSEVLPRGQGSISPGDMLALLQSARCYLYMGTQPASYTLGLLEALMVGVPVISITPRWHHIFPYGPQLFEGAALSPLQADTPLEAYDKINVLLGDHALAQQISQQQRFRVCQEFDMDVVGRAWKAYLG